MTPLGIVGASARAAAVSAVRAGFAPWAVDLFADRDLRRIAHTVRCPMDEYPSALPRLVDVMPPGPVIYTGGLENHPEVLRDLAARREVWGNLPENFGYARDPRFLALPSHIPRVSPPVNAPLLEPCPKHGRWVRKRFNSAGGMDVRFGEPGEPASRRHFFQLFADGLPMSMLFVTSCGTGRAETRCLGVTEQLVGESWLHAEPFAYCGNVGPVDLPDEVRDGLVRYGSLVAGESGLRGVWGLDFVFDDTTAHPVEVNPRYTASAEVLELAGWESFLTRHALEFAAAPLRTFSKPSRAAVVGKAIYYAPHALAFPIGPWDDELSRPFDPWRVPDFADIPDAGSVIEAGQPVLTVFATGDTPAAVRRELQSRAAELDALLS